MIVRWDGVSVDNSDELSTLISLTPPGTRVRLRVLRDGTAIACDVQVAALRLP